MPRTRSESSVRASKGLFEDWTPISLPTKASSMSLSTWQRSTEAAIEQSSVLPEVPDAAEQDAAHDLDWRLY